MEYNTLSINPDKVIRGRETDKAWCIEVAKYRSEDSVIIFVPKSVCRFKTNSQVEVPTWLVDKWEEEHGKLSGVL